MGLIKSIQNFTANYLTQNVAFMHCHSFFPTPFSYFSHETYYVVKKIKKTVHFLSNVYILFFTFKEIFSLASFIDITTSRHDVIMFYWALHIFFYVVYAFGLFFYKFITLKYILYYYHYFVCKLLAM